MLNFEYNIPGKIFFGQGQLDALGNEILEYGSTILLAYGKGSIKKTGLYNQVVQQLQKYDIAFCELADIDPNPRIESVNEGVKLCRKHQVDLILGVGGGSVIDCVKAVAAGFYYDGDPWDFYTGKATIGQALPLGTVLTLAATGSEMNGNSVISHPAKNLKLATGSPLLRPKFSILDPEYTFTVNAYQTASGTADIISHCLEQYFTGIENTYIQDRITESIIKTCIEFGPKAIENPKDYNARANLMWASSLALNGLISLGKKGDWATHQIEHTLSAHFDLTHGVGLAIITPHWMEHVLNDQTVQKFADLAYHVWHIEHADPYQMAKEGIERLKAFFGTLKLPKTLAACNISIDSGLLNQMAEEAVMFGPLGHIQKIEKEDVLNILTKCL